MQTPKICNYGLYWWIKNSGLTQTEVANVCGITQQALSNIIVLGCFPKASTLHALCSNYGLAYNDLYGWCKDAEERRKENSQKKSSGPIKGQLTIFDL